MSARLQLKDEVLAMSLLTLIFFSKAGCVKSPNTTREWLIQNFQSFSTRASLGYFTALKKDFNGVSR